MAAVVDQVSETERQALKQDCVKTIQDLTVQIDSREADAATDPMVAADLDDMRSSRSAAESQLRDILEAEHQERQAHDAEAVEARERQARHMDRAREIEAGPLPACRERVDQTAKAFAEAVGEFVQVKRELATALTLSGNRQLADIARPRSQPINSTLRFHLRQAQVPASAMELPPMSAQHVKPVSESDPVAIAPEAA
jgi:hypothetical protein